MGTLHMQLNTKSVRRMEQPISMFKRGPVRQIEKNFLCQYNATLQRIEISNTEKSYLKGIRWDMVWYDFRLETDQLRLKNSSLKTDYTPIDFISLPKCIVSVVFSFFCSHILMNILQNLLALMLRNNSAENFIPVG